MVGPFSIQESENFKYQESRLEVVNLQALSGLQSRTWGLLWTLGVGSGGRDFTTLRVGVLGQSQSILSRLQSPGEMHHLITDKQHYPIWEFTKM